MKVLVHEGQFKDQILEVVSVSRGPSDHCRDTWYTVALSDGSTYVLTGESVFIQEEDSHEPTK